MLTQRAVECSRSICLESETTRLIRDGEKGGRGYGGGWAQREINKSVTTRINMVPLNVIIVRDKVTRQCAETTTETIRLIRDGEKGEGGM